MTSKSKTKAHASKNSARKSEPAAVIAAPATPAPVPVVDDEDQVVRREMSHRGSSSYEDEQMLRRMYEAGKAAAHAG